MGLTHRNALLALAAFCLMTMASAAQANGNSLEITGAFFSTMPTPLRLCAELTPSASGAPVTFNGVTPYNIKTKAGPMNTNALGLACVRANWPQNIYTVRATANVNGGVTSPPVAVSVYNPRNFCGVQGGGALHLLSYGVPPSVQHQSLPARQATYALIYKLNPGKNFGILYYDNDNPLGAVSFVAKSYESVIDTSEVGLSGPTTVGAPDYTEMEFRGVGRAVLNGVPTLVHYYVLVDDYADDNYFYIELWSLTGHLLYESADPDDEGEEQHVYDGKNVITPCAI